MALSKHDTVLRLDPPVQKNVDVISKDFFMINYLYVLCACQFVFPTHV